MAKRKPKIIENEWELAIWTSLLLYNGTSITDGALKILDEIDRRNKELKK